VWIEEQPRGGSRARKNVAGSHQIWPGHDHGTLRTPRTPRTPRNSTHAESDTPMGDISAPPGPFPTAQSTMVRSQQASDGVLTRALESPLILSTQLQGCQGVSPSLSVCLAASCRGTPATEAEARKLTPHGLVEKQTGPRLLPHIDLAPEIHDSETRETRETRSFPEGSPPTANRYLAAQGREEAAVPSAGPKSLSTSSAAG